MTQLQANTAAKHTPGPWRVIREKGYYARAVEATHGWTSNKDKRRICSVRPYPYKQEVFAEAEANAFLISAAPEMFEALKRAREELRLIHMKDTGAIYDVSLRVYMDIVIAKAEMA